MAETPPINVAGRWIGPGQPCFVIAEAGVNHNGQPALAKRLVEVAKAAGADAVKFQTFRAERLTTPDGPQFEMLRRLALSPAAHAELVASCRQAGVLFLSSPFDDESADLLDRLGVAAFKLGSGEMTNWPFLAYVARKGKPIILSTGMSSLGEVGEAVRVIRDAGNGQVILLHCVSSYPADPADANLRAMRTMADAFHLPVGFSDHTQGIEVALAAVALGACVIEKHITLARTLPGPDHRASLEPPELHALLRGIRLVERALGHGRKEPVPSEAELATVVRRSIVAARDIPRGTALAAESLTSLRPASGLPPSLLAQILGRTARQDIPAGTMLTWAMLA
ncbi:MAG: N-acetylneuraminate synthase family protein [Candidatus Omnitrophica bacterium]|nr:N-acetylneuraminate synthase family protein [Candidatus Omnitrophota bacterium]